DARHIQADDNNRRNLHEQWLRTFAEIDAMAIPQTSPIVFDDLERWEEVRKRKPVSLQNDDGTSDAETDPVMRRLESTRVPVVFGTDGEGATLSSVAEYLQNVTGINFVISTLLKDEDEEETSINLNLPERSVKKLLDLIAETSEFVRWKIENGVVNLVLPEEMTGGQVLRFYEVRDLIRPITNFPGREINVQPTQGIDAPDEDIEELDALVVTGDDLDGLIRDFVHPESWDADENNDLRVTESGTLIVNQTPAVHEQIEQLLNDLREATGIMVDIEARFLKIEDNFLEDIGVDFRGLGAPGVGTNEFFNDFGDSTETAELGDSIGQGNDLGAFFNNGDAGQVGARIENLYDSDLGDDGVLTGSGGLSFQWTYLQDLELELILRAVAKSERVELVTSPHILVHNTARSNLTVLNQIAYVQDYDVEIAQAASIANPIIAVIEDGVILDVRPVVSADRRFITVEMRPTVAELLRPIPEFTTSLGGGTAVTIQLPQLQLSRVRTSVSIPDGATVLLGGLRIREEENLQSGIPILNKIPIISLLFERKGHFVTSRKLLILLKAEIVIPTEYEPELGALDLR
ncbi:MAG: type II secretory pathway component GspD/PulD (secretin), partial [Planctomycetota bacterium]